MVGSAWVLGGAWWMVELLDQIDQSLDLTLEMSGFELLTAKAETDGGAL